MDKMQKYIESCKKRESLNAHVNFGGRPDKLKMEYLDVYEGVYAEIVSSDRFDEDTDLSTMYLGQIDMTRDTEVKAEENFPHNHTRLHKREIEGVIGSWDSCVNFLNWLILFFPREKASVKPKEQKILTLEAPFIEEISGNGNYQNVRY